MGGKALNKYGVHTERKNTDEFLVLGKEIQYQIYTDFGYKYGDAIETAIVTCYHTKADHGDLDLLIKITPNLSVNWKTYIQEIFKPQAIYNNGGVFSFDYKNFQVDFIPINASKWETAKVYYSYDPLGNIMGKTFHKFGLSYGWEGLLYKYRNFNGKNSQNILLTNDARAIFEFGGYDYDRYLKGFDTLEEIFQFAVDCYNFDTEIFQMENLKSIDKKRNRKRGSYHLFLKYLKDNNINIRHKFNDDKTAYLTAIDLYFPEAKLMDKLEELQKKDALNKALAEKFNGEIIMQWLPELKGKALGEAIGSFKNRLGGYYDEYILNNDIENIRDLFLTIYNERN
jgi:hypothetical protein